MSMAGGKIKPEDLFDSLRTVKEQHKRADPNQPVSQKFVDRFKHLFSEKVEFLDD